MSDHDWNESYRSGETPWDIGVPDEHLVRFVQGGQVTRCRALEIGCGTGTNARWLAEQGFSVVAVDLSALAIEKAKAPAARGPGSVEFRCLDFLKDSVSGGPFEFVFDRGCFHVFDEASDRLRFADRVHATLSTGGSWLSLIGSTEGAPREFGPPRRTARDITSAIEPALALIELKATFFRANLPDETPGAWFCLSQKRKLPAQPSTRR